MLQGVCVDTGQTAVLEMGKKYFLFPNGPKHYYVSNFPDRGSHKGCFQSFYFQILEKEEWPPEPEAKTVYLDPLKIYLAKLNWREPGYKMIGLKEYYLKPRTTHCDFYHDAELKRLCGCFPLHWFSDFREVETENAYIVTNLDENVPFFTESEPKNTKYEQLSLFDF